ncbi:MAG: LptA/OstA family protein [Gammaproteobacteria bacterium]
MAVFFPDFRSRHTLPLSACALCAVLALLLAPPAYGQQQEITLEAASSDFDRRNERLVFQDIRVRQGDIEISADQAESRDLDFSRGSWLFLGNVRISSPMGQIESARASVSFTDHRLHKATAEGSPATFSRTLPEPENRTVTGTANRIVYDLVEGELELAGKAMLRDGLREVSGGRLVYRITEDRLIASTDDEGIDRVRIIITPPEEDDAP